MEEIIKKLKEHDNQFDTINKKLEEHDSQLDIIARTVAEHTERFDRMEEKLDGMATKNDIVQIMNTLDKIVGLNNKNEEEITVLAYNHKNLDHRVALLEANI